MTTTATPPHSMYTCTVRPEVASLIATWIALVPELSDDAAHVTTGHISKQYATELFVRADQLMANTIPEHRHTYDATIQHVINATDRLTQRAISKSIPHASDSPTARILTRAAWYCARTATRRAAWSTRVPAHASARQARDAARSALTHIRAATT